MDFICGAIDSSRNPGKSTIYYTVLGLGLLIIYISLLMKKIKQNRFLGIKNKYTLSNDIVWTKNIC